MASETVNQQRSRLLHCQLTNGVNWRNNSGACTDETGRLIRYGLGNDSAQLNASVKSSDLIGITPEWAYIERFGWRWVGVFTALEIKPSGWSLRPGDARGLAQAKFHDIVTGVGGFAGFITDPETDIRRIIGRE